MDEVFKNIKSRRSVRCFKQDPVPQELLERIVEAGSWAPSGLNNQPWKFKLVTGKDEKNDLAALTKYGRTVSEAPAVIAVFLDNTRTYDRTKDVQAIGACIQNMLLFIHSEKLGACWLGEILNRREDAEKVMNVSANNELMALIALGYPISPNQKGNRISYKDLLL